jgi:hypothetical protein
VVPVLLVGGSLAGLASAWAVRLKRQADVTRTGSLIGAVEVALQDFMAEHPGWHAPRPPGTSASTTQASADPRTLDGAESQALFAELEKSRALNVPPDRRREGQVLDAWGRPLRIAVGQSPGGEVAFEIASAGRDGAWDTDDDLRRSVLGEAGTPRGPRTRPATTHSDGR